MIYAVYSEMSATTLRELGSGLLGGGSVTLLIALLVMREVGRRGRGMSMEKVSRLAWIAIVPLAIEMVFIFDQAFHQL